MKAYPSIPTPISGMSPAAASAGCLRRSAHAHARCIAASKATADGAKSVRRTNASASCAPYSRSIPESSHSIDSGPV